MSEYAEVEDVEARAGEVARAWTTSREYATSREDIETFLDSAAAYVNAVLASRGHATPTEHVATREALREPVAILALESALRASPGAAPQHFRDEVIAAADRFRAALLDGTWPGLGALEADTGGSPAAAADADSLWTSGAGAHPYRTQRRVEPGLITKEMML